MCDVSQVLMAKENTYYNAEVLSVRCVEGIHEYYVHWLDFNRRLDQWVRVEKLDLSDVRYNESRKDGKLQNISRSSTPDSDSGGKDKKKKLARKASAQFTYPARYSMLSTPATPTTPMSVLDGFADEMPQTIPPGHGKGMR